TACRDTAMNEHLSIPGAVPLSLQKRVDEACDGFEAAWRAGQRPRIEEYLADLPEPDPQEFLRALLALELELRSAGGDKPAPEEYEQRFGDHVELIKVVFAEARSLHDSEWSPGNGEPSTVDEGTLPNQAVPDRSRRYRVCSKLGEGAFGKVYLAHDDVMERPVAIKVPSTRLLASQIAREQFLSEARSVARLQHKGIVCAHDFGEEAGVGCYIVYQFIE